MGKIDSVVGPSVGASYRRLRYFAGAALIGMPILTVFSGFYLDHPLQLCFSDYYFLVKDGGLPRSLQVMFLAFLGGVLLSYRGLDKTDNFIHNLAGLFAFGIALFPMACDDRHIDCVGGIFPCLHGPSALGLYFSAIASVIYSGGSSLKKSLADLNSNNTGDNDDADDKKGADNTWLKRLLRIKLLSLVMMTIGIIISFSSAAVVIKFPDFKWIFWVEYLGFAGFGIYWIRFMWFINDANNEGQKKMSFSLKRTAEREASHAPSGFFKTGVNTPQVFQWNDIP